MRKAAGIRIRHAEASVDEGPMEQGPNATNAATGPLTQTRTVTLGTANTTSMASHAVPAVGRMEMWDTSGPITDGQ